jgi:hypothetical protein
MKRFLNVFNITSGLQSRVSLAIPYIAIRSVEDIRSYDGGNVNNYLSLSLCMNVP